MPTPFTHLLAAPALLDQVGLSSAVRSRLAAEWPAFLLGNIAPDVQTLSGQTREATHFFPVPLNGAPPAHRVSILDGGPEAFPRMLAAIERAAVSVHLEVYSFALDATGERPRMNDVSSRIDCAVFVLAPT